MPARREDLAAYLSMPMAEPLDASPQFRLILLMLPARCFPEGVAAERASSLYHSPGRRRPLRLTRVCVEEGPPFRASLSRACTDFNSRALLDCRARFATMTGCPACQRSLTRSIGCGRFAPASGLPAPSGRRYRPPPLSAALYIVVSRYAMRGLLRHFRLMTIITPQMRCAATDAFLGRGLHAENESLHIARDEGVVGARFCLPPQCRRSRRICAVPLCISATGVSATTLFCLRLPGTLVNNFVATASAENYDE